MTPAPDRPVGTRVTPTKRRAQSKPEADDAVGRRRLAERIARELFTPGGRVAVGLRAQRLVMEMSGERVEGMGWSERPMADRIEDLLERYGR